MGMQFQLLKCSNYLNIHQAGKQRQSEFPLLKCYNMGLERRGGGGEQQYNLQKEHYKKKFKYFQAWRQIFFLLSSVVQLQLNLVYS